MCVYTSHHISARCLQRLEEGFGSSGTEVTDICESLCGCWGPKLGPLDEQQVLFIIEPSL